MFDTSSFTLGEEPWMRKFEVKNELFPLAEEQKQQFDTAISQVHQPIGLLESTLQATSESGLALAKSTSDAMADWVRKTPSMNENHTEIVNRNTRILGGVYEKCHAIFSGSGELFRSRQRLAELHQSLPDLSGPVSIRSESELQLVLEQVNLVLEISKLIHEELRKMHTLLFEDKKGYQGIFQEIQQARELIRKDATLESAQVDTKTDGLLVSLSEGLVQQESIVGTIFSNAVSAINKPLAPAITAKNQLTFFLTQLQK